MATRLLPLAALLLAGCTVGPNFTAPVPRAPDRWSRASLEAPAYARSRAEARAVDETWWEGFHDPTLTWLVITADQGNPDIEEAAARIAETRQQRSVAYAGFWPTVEANASDTRLRLSQNSPFASIAGGQVSAGGGGPPNAGQGLAIPTGPKPGFAIYQGSFDAAWELDIFGRTRRGVEAAEADILGAERLLDNARLSLRAEAARTYLELRGLQARQAIARQSLRLQRDNLGLTRSRFTSGFATEVDVANAEALVASTESTLPLLDAQVTQAMNRLARLLGQEPGTLSGQLAAPAPVPPAPPAVAIGLPIETIRRRPDVASAEAALAAQTARIGVATAQLYPSLRINGSIGLQAGNTANLFDTASRFFSIGPSLLIPIFEGGRLRAQVRLEEARQRTAAIAWRRTVLDALHEVENALAAYYGDQGRRDGLRRQASAARRAADTARTRFSAGLGTFLEVLDADRTRLSAELAVAETTAAVATDLVAVYKALGGGWQPGGAGPVATP
ncbi:efflux transporter outer membrane subunit [Paracraurococcus lichenis]|uniref:Efflux transporter outer membrane subunit n=1 Tax=Paracraurococcus lichenis TaxID=3064888 RepID=A0ABT9DZN8_9PROT|nr:efflux transporter outer membrane subunit [Paracraurococcus sp. LOR1-02]MDO9709374.1 efflux transporter outer membrane subunit [Paracraurococcus sp. LOR1-02]